MCGIVGRLNYREPVKSEIIEVMTNAITQRGPDDVGYFIDGNLGFGFRRLSIIDLNSGHQPMVSSSGNFVIVFNGEIYNFRVLREDLVKRGYIFKTCTDTEVILNLYEEYGEQSLQYLRGMFAFAVWDIKNKKLFCARDRFGIKPFFYYDDNEKFIFGSEIKALLKCPDIDLKISPEGLDSYFAYGYITKDLSIYQNIKKLLPGYCMTISLEKNSVELKKYWKIDFQPDHTKSENYWCEEIRNCLEETIKLHMISDVPIGAFLSGGIDSSSVVAMMAQHSKQPINTFSIGFKEKKYNELDYAREIAAKYNCVHHERIIEPESIGILSKLVDIYDEPFADSSAIPTYFVSKFAREHVTVILSGDGGDELFAGYDIYNYLNKIKQYYLPNEKLNNFLFSTLNKMLPSTIPGKGVTRLLTKRKKYLGAYINIWSKEERQKLLLDNKSKGIDAYKIGLLEKSNNDFITNLQNLDLQTYLVDDILTKVDRASMANSLEVRVPLLDHKFAELTFKIPNRMKLNGQTQKYIFKKAMVNYLTPNVIEHPKQGFSVPLSNWFKDELRSYIHDSLLSTNARINEYLDKKMVKNTIMENEKGLRDFSMRVWSLLFFEEWLKANKKG